MTVRKPARKTTIWNRLAHKAHSKDPYGKFGKPAKKQVSKK